jgi:hypothetical protein
MIVYMVIVQSERFKNGVRILTFLRITDLGVHEEAEPEASSVKKKAFAIASS